MTNEEFIKNVSLEGEIWKDVVGYEGHYKVSNIGRIISCGKYLPHFHAEKRWVKPRLLSCPKAKNGYRHIILYKGSNKKDMRIHRIVATAFIPNPENKPQIDHIDRNRCNNNVDNLRWCTGSENMRNPLTIPILKSINKGRKRPYAYRPVVAIKNGIVVYNFEKLTDCEKYGFRYSQVINICAGRRKTHKGFTFMYLSDYESLINMSKNS